MSVTSPAPEQRTIGRLGSRKARRFSPWLLLPLLLILAILSYAIWQFTRPASSAATTSTATASVGTLSVSVSGSGTVSPVRTQVLSFPVSATVTDVLVEVGDTVTAGQSLATVDTKELELAVQQAAANVKSAEATVAAANGQGATPEEIAAAEAQLRSAQAQYSQTINGTTTASSIQSARAQLTSAQANLDLLLSGPDESDLASAQASVQDAQITLSSQRSSLSAAKINAENDVTTSANSLRDAQDAYSTIYWQNREREKAPGSLSQDAKDEETAAQRAVTTAEANLQQAQLAYEQAKQNEITGIQQAETQLSLAQDQLAVLQKGATDAEIASARASVASAQANLNSLLEGATAEERTIAESSLEQAQISFDQLTAPGSEVTITSAEASLAQAQVTYEQAQMDLENATLTAPFAGTISAVAISAGDTAGTDTTITLIDTASYYVELSLGESDVADVALGQPVTLTFDALPDVTIEGVVESIAPTATVTSNVATYPVKVSFTPGDAAIKVGMSASGTITVEEHADALLVPSRAVQTQGNSQVVQVRQATGQPAVSVQVETGLTSDGQTEIISCVDTGNLCLQAGDVLVVTNTTSTTGTTNNTTTLGGAGGFGGGFGGGAPPTGGFGGGRP